MPGRHADVEVDAVLGLLALGQRFMF
jgi:hypothetical protein